MIERTRTRAGTAIAALAVAFAATIAAPALSEARAQAAKTPDAHGHGTAAGSSPTGASARVAKTSGEVRQIDRTAGKITLKHGPIESLQMPAMTMVFRVKDSAMLERVKTGDKVAFVAENVNGSIVVTQIEPAR